MTMKDACPFCELPAGRVLFRNDAAVAVRDAHPVTPGHTLVIPLRHVASFFDATLSEREAMLALLDTAKHQLQSEYGPAGYNIGINDGAAAGQTIGHLTAVRLKVEQIQLVSGVGHVGLGRIGLQGA
jgi:diadenosine tetraphosphate (Ap4A) HIT family hydrolase